MALVLFPFPRACDSTRSNCTRGGDLGQGLTWVLDSEAVHPSCPLPASQDPQPHLSPFLSYYSRLSLFCKKTLFTFKGVLLLFFFKERETS
jgi:hypothetical protein